MSLLDTGIQSFTNYQSTKRTNKAIIQNAALDRALNMASMKQGLSWRAEDALNASKKYGINHLALLGQPTFSPQSQHIGAIQAPDVMSHSSRGIGAIGKAMQLAQLDRMKLQNTLLEKEIAAANTNNPLGPEAEYNKPQLDKSAFPGIRGGAGPGQQYAVLDDNTLLKLPSKDVQEAVSEEVMSQTRYALKEVGEAVHSLMIINQPIETQLAFAKKLRKIRPDYILKQYDIKGSELQWNLAKSRWEIHKAENKMFAHNRLTHITQRDIKYNKKNTRGWIDRKAYRPTGKQTYLRR